MKKRWMSAMLVCVILWSFVLGGCGQEESEKTTITIIHAWGGTEDDHVAMREIFEGFQKENPDIQFNMISMPTRDKMLRKIEDMIMVGDTPDIIDFAGMGANSTYNFMLDNHMALDLMPYVQSDQELLRCIPKLNLDYWTTSNHQLFTIPDVLSLSGGYWYNEDIIEKVGITEIPKTWDRFFTMCETIKAWAARRNSDTKPLQVSTEGYLYFADQLIAESGVKLKKATGENTMNVPDEAYAHMMKQLQHIYEYSSSDNENYSYRDETSLFNEGRLAICINGVWGAPMISDDINAKYALLPTTSGASVSCESVSLGYVLGNSGSVEKQNASVRFLKYIMSERVQAEILKKTGQIPANPNLNLEAYEAEMPRLSQAVNLVLTADDKIDIPDNVWTADEKKLFTDHILKVLSKETSDQIIRSLYQ